MGSLGFIIIICIIGAILFSVMQTNREIAAGAVALIIVGLGVGLFSPSLSEVLVKIGEFVLIALLALTVYKAIR